VTNNSKTTDLNRGIAAEAVRRFIAEVAHPTACVLGLSLLLLASAYLTIAGYAALNRHDVALLTSFVPAHFALAGFGLQFFARNAWSARRYGLAVVFTVLAVLAAMAITPAHVAALSARHAPLLVEASKPAGSVPQEGWVFAPLLLASLFIQICQLWLVLELYRTSRLSPDLDARAQANGHGKADAPTCNEHLGGPGAELPASSRPTDPAPPAGVSSLHDRCLPRDQPFLENAIACVRWLNDSQLDAEGAIGASPRERLAFLARGPPSGTSQTSNQVQPRDLAVAGNVKSCQCESAAP
jgi:hypothetical protein